VPDELHIPYGDFFPTTENINYGVVSGEGGDGAGLSDGCPGGNGGSSGTVLAVGGNGGNVPNKPGARGGRGGNNWWASNWFVLALGADGGMEILRERRMFQNSN
jgi:hypothetical protein